MVVFLNIYIIIIFSQMRNRDRDRLKKLKYFPINKPSQQSLNKKIQKIKVHSIPESEAEILLPRESQKEAKPGDIYQIICRDRRIYAQVSEESFANDQSEISILNNLAAISEVTCENGLFEGEVHLIEKQNIPREYHLEIVQFFVEAMYFSRRDQYKVLKDIKKRIIHVYCEKMLEFDCVKLKVVNMLESQVKIRKSGIITKDTKIIFRSTCCKYAILIEISQEMFQLNENKELYLEKAMQFLTVFFQRNKQFENSHRIQIILYARLFYPKFKTLKSAYDNLIREASQFERQEIFSANMAVTLQKNHDGKIYQDAYRKILFPSDTTYDFRQKIEESVSEFMFTINWKCNYEHSYAKYFAQSVEKKSKQNITLSKSKQSKPKPFRHRLSSQLAHSKDCNFFQAISLISEQYKHHYHFRNLKQTGNAITIISAGNSVYNVDQVTYQFTEANIYLANISCIQINLKRKVDKIKAILQTLPQKPLYEKQDRKKLEKLIDFCIQKDVYLSPSNIELEFAEKFMLNSMIFPEDIKQMKEKVQILEGYPHKCRNDVHYKHDEKEQTKKEEKQRDTKAEPKQIEWISSYYMSNEVLHVHEKVYPQKNFKIDFLSELEPFTDPNENEVKNFERDLKIILNKSKNREIQKFLSPRQTSSTRKMKELISQVYTQKKNDRNYQLSDQFIQKCQKTIFYQFNQRSSSKQKIRPRHKPNQITKEGQIEEEKKNKYPKVNILQQTFQKRQYNAPKTCQQKRASPLTTNYQQRLKKLEKQSQIHYLMQFYNKQTLKILQVFIRKHIDPSLGYFQFQKIWKNICFPPLTPIYTNYRETDNDLKVHPKYTKNQPNIVEDEICQYLMMNYQIQGKETKNKIILTKGRNQCELVSVGQDQVSVNEIIQNTSENQQSLIPKILYRYLCYQEKDYRFCRKWINFSNENQFVEGKNQEKKSVKLVMIYDDSKGSVHQDKKIQYFTQFIKQLKDKYKQLEFMKLQKGAKMKKSTVDIISMNLAKNLVKNKIYKLEQISLIIDTEYFHSNLFKLVIEWDYCCASLIQDFISNIKNVCMKNRILPFFTNKQDVFNIHWNVDTIGEIVFESKTGLDLLKIDIERGDNKWFWDSQGFFMDRGGKAFIRFPKDKNLIEWKDNNVDNTRWKVALNEQNNFYNEFFLQSAPYNWIGRIIDRIFETKVDAQKPYFKDFQSTQQIMRYD